MKIFVLEYNFHIITIYGERKEAEHRIEMFHDVNEFMKKTKYVLEKDTHEIFGIKYIENVKTYVGEVSEINPNLVLNPF